MKKLMDFKIGDRVLVLAGDNKDRVGTVQGHDSNLLILSFDKETTFKGVHFMNVVKWFEKI